MNHYSDRKGPSTPLQLTSSFSKVTPDLPRLLWPLQTCHGTMLVSPGAAHGLHPGTGAEWVYGCISPRPWWWHFNDLQNLSSWIQGETHWVGNAPREGSKAWLEHKLRFGLHLLSSLDKIAGKWHSLFEALIPCLWRKAVITTCFTWLIGIAEMSHHPGCVIYQISFSGPVTWLEAVNYRVGGGCTITVINEGLIELMLSAVPWSHLLAIQMDILGEPVHVVLLVHASLPYYQVK